jgi:hypothetical protein
MVALVEVEAARQRGARRDAQPHDDERDHARE